MAYNDQIRQRKNMAQGKGPMPDDDFGVKRPGVREHMERGRDGKHLADHERSASQPLHHGVAKLPAQANPDHGPHHVHKKGAGSY